jgi:hypothetical protein
MSLLFPQKARAALAVNAFSDDDRTYKRKKRYGWKKRAEELLGKKDVDYKEIRMIRTESAINFNERQRAVAEDHTVSTGKVTRRLSSRRDAWKCKCVEAAEWINGGNASNWKDGEGKTPAEIAEKADSDGRVGGYTAPLHPNCLTAGTMIKTLRGDIPIEKITISDFVMGDSGNPRRVIKVHHNLYTGNIFTIKPRGMKSISLTYNHPVFIFDRGWVEAECVKQGDKLYTPDSIAVITSVRRHEKTDLPVYNLSVDIDNDFFANGILVHNCDCVDLPVMKSAKEVREDLFEKYFGEDALSKPVPKWEPPEGILVNPGEDDLSYRAGVDTGSPGAETPKPPVNPVKLMDKENLEQEQKKSDKFFADHVLNNPMATRAVRGYTNDGKKDIGHREINLAQLGEKPMTKAIENRVKALEKLADEYVLDKDIMVYRGLSADYIADWEIGGTYSPKMFTSTSANIYSARKFADKKVNPIIIEVRVAKGTKGFYIGDNTFYEKSDGKKEPEWEFLLGNKVKYTVISKEQKGAWQYWIVEARNE